jgi:signal transduction histidine kinase/CheY-like chemotaxis protein
MDITERYLHETTLREEAETLEILNKIGQLLSAELDLQKLVQGVTDAATSLTGAQYGSFFYNRTDDTGQSYLLYTLSGVPREHFAHFPMPRATDLFGPTFRGEGTLRLEDVRKDRRYGQSSPYYGLPPGHLPVVSYLATPVISRSGEVLGGLFFGHSEPSRFTERHERIVLGLAAQTAVAMDNARLFSATQQEIAERRRTEVELQRAKEVAETANNAKNQFLAVLSHELRTPLNPTLTAVQAIEEDPVLAEELRPLVEIIHRNVELEARLIDDLLDVTRIERGKLELEQEQVNSHDLLRHVIRTCEGELNKKQLRTSVELTAQQHTLYADPARLQQIYWNLISNAIKFTPQGGTVTVRTFNDAEQRLITEITDTGIGISDEDTARIFDAFEQGERTITRQYGGLGLGLSISKSLIELHGGTLTASSAGKNMGATFSVTMPTVAQNTSATDRIMPSEQEQSPSATILVVEDHTDTRKVMKLLLERRGYNVETASTIADALNTARSLSYDFLISDIGLPDGSGIELLKQLEEIRTVPAIALSGFGMEEDRKRSLAAGFAAHLVKPVDFQLLDTTIRQLLSAKR